MEAIDDDLTTIYTGNLLTIALTGFIDAATSYGLNFVSPPGVGLSYPLFSDSSSGSRR